MLYLNSETISTVSSLLTHFLCLLNICMQSEKFVGAARLRLRGAINCSLYSNCIINTLIGKKIGLCSP